MMRWLTAGESHGEALTALIEGLPAGVPVTSAGISAALARRRLGYGRGARMKFEQDQVTILGGVRHGETMGSPVLIQIGNTEWPKWETVMSADPVPADVLAAQARAEALTRPRPGHADSAGMAKYGLTDIRPILERASARETAARVALGHVAANFLHHVFGIQVISHVLSIGTAAVPAGAAKPQPEDRDRIDADPVRCFHPAASAQLVAHIDQTRKAGDTLGGVVETIAYGVPPGLGSHIQWDRRLDTHVAAAMMSIQAIKGVEIGAGFETARTPGSQTHDQIHPDAAGRIYRETNNAGGIEGGMSNGEPIVVRSAMKPISTVPRALATVDVTTGESAAAIHQRSDVCAVPAAGVITEAMLALVLAQAAMDKFGGDHVHETMRNATAYCDHLPAALRPKEAQ